MGGRGATSGNLTNTQGQAIEYYVSGDGMYINNVLRNGETLTAEDKRFIGDLDAALNVDVANKTLYRSVDAQAIFGKMSDIEYDNLKSAVIYGSKDKFSQSALNKANQSIGKTVTEKGYMSTTRSSQVAEDWGGFSGSSKPVVMKITTTKGVKGRDVSKATKNLSKAEANDPQRETLIGRGHKYNIKRLYSKNGNIYVDVTLKK